MGMPAGTCDANAMYDLNVRVLVIRPECYVMLCHLSPYMPELAGYDLK